MMLSIEKCRELLGETNLSDEQISDLRESLYTIIENILDEYHKEIVAKQRGLY